MKVINFGDAFYHINFGFELLFGNMFKQKRSTFQLNYSVSVFIFNKLKTFWSFCVK